MSYKKSIFIFVMLVVIFATTPTHPLNTNNIAGTYTLLPQKLRELSPLVGAVVWSQRVIEGLYDDGHLTPGEPKDTRNQYFKQELANWRKAIPSSGIKIIIRNLFNRPPGTKGQSDFRPSKTIYDSPKTLIEKIGYNLAQLFLYKTLEPLLEGKNSTHRKARLSGILTFKKIGKVTSQDFYQAYGDEIYPGDQIIEYALLSLLWVTAHNDRTLIKRYFTTLRQELDNGIKKLQTSLNSPNLSQLPFPALGLLIPQEQTKAIANFAQALNQIETMILQFTPEQFDILDQITVDDTSRLQNKTTHQILEDSALCEILAYLILHSQPHPPILTLGGEYLTFTLEANKKVHNLRACFEVELRNLLNFFALDPTTRQYSAAQLEKTLGRKVHPDLAAFYSTYSDPQKTNTQEAEIAWVKIMTNIDNIAYLITSELQPPKSSKTYDYKNPIESYHIRLTDVIDEKIKAALHKLQLCVPATSSLTHYELQGTIRNFILILNHLLQLNLFTDKNLGMELAQDSFIETYLPIVLKQLGAAKNFSTKRIRNSSPDLGSLEFFLPRFQTKAKFSFTREHADLELKTLRETSLQELNQLNESEISSFELLPFLLSSSEYKKLTDSGFREIITYFAHLKFLDNQDFLPSIAKKPLTQNWYTLINYMKTKTKIYAVDEEKIIINALEQNLKDAKKDALDFIEKHKNSDKVFPKNLWAYLLEKNAEDSKLSEEAFSDAQNKIRQGSHHTKDAAIDFLTSQGLATNNTSSTKVAALLKEILTKKIIPSEYRNFVLFGLKEALLSKKIPFSTAKPLFDLVCEKSKNALVECLITRLQTLLKKNVITYHEAIFYLQAIENRTSDRSLCLKKLILLEDCLEKGMPIKEAVKQLAHITYDQAALEELHHPMISCALVTAKYRILVNELLEKEPELRTDKKFWNMVAKHVSKHDLEIFQSKLHAVANIENK